MAKEICKKPHLNIGTIGHIDHGKTTLTAAMHLARHGGADFTPFDMIDKAPEERSAAASPSTSHVEYQTRPAHFRIDCPRH